MTEAVLARKIAELRARTSRVRELLPATVEEFIAHRTEAEALTLNLYLALQASTDIALHSVADRGLGVPGDARGALSLLESAGILTGELARKLSAAIGMRNRIAHQYGTLDLSLVYASACAGLDDLESFASAIAGAPRI